MRKSREYNKIENSVRNLSVAIISYFITILFVFLDRTVFLHFLNTDYLGLNGLFSNILNMLSLAELGVGSAIAYSLYEPLHTRNIPIVQSIMKLYKKLYFLIGIVILLLGSLLTPLLSTLIKDMPFDISIIYIYYLLYVLNVSSSYFFNYKRTLIICDQKQYISTLTTTFSCILTSIMHIVILCFTHNYMFYLIVGILMTIGENIVISYIANKIYPFLKEKNVNHLPKENIVQIKKNVYAMFCHKIGNVVVNYTDNLIISSFVGLGAIGLYSNYTLILTGIEGLLGKFFSSVTASVGALVLEKDKIHVEQILYNMLFLNFWVYACCSIAFFCLIQPFISLWIGSAYQMTLSVVLIIALKFYISGMRKTILTFRDSAGVFWYDRYKALIESVVNVLLSIPLAIEYGVGGVLLGTIGSTLLVSFWYDGYILFKYLFHKSVGNYLHKQFIYGICTISVGLITFYICNLISIVAFASFLFRILICIIVPNTLFILIFRQNNEFSYLYILYRDLRKKITNKIKSFVTN